MPHDTAFEHRLDALGRPTEARQPKPSPRPDPCADPCAPRCPACGGLECLCRPRFFPGQLLTDDDLNRLSRYVVEKNKLHNRYLHGWGVACGLEVTCDPCDPKQVIVRTGYALGPCGDDIIVCNDTAVDICEKIDECRPPRQTVCDPPYERAPQDCRGGNNRWVLAICYDERPSRGLTALLGAGDSRCKQPCSCGGSAGCSRCGGSGCGCGGSCGCGGGAAGPGSCPAPKNDYTARPRRKLQPNCEPTQICEGYRFVVYPAPPTLTRVQPPDLKDGGSAVGQILAWMFANRERLGPLLERVLCCVARARELLATWGSSAKIDQRNALQVYSQYAASLYEFASEFTVHRCAFVGRVGVLYERAQVFERKYGLAQLDNAGLDYAKDQLEQLESALLQIVSECFCAALLPPCPEPVASNCVPLAVVTLRANDCRVIDICNWEQRKILLTWRTVAYWLSWIPWHCIRYEIAQFCCGDKRDGPIARLLGLVFGLAMVGLFCGDPRRKAAAIIPRGALDREVLLRQPAERSFDLGGFAAAAARPVVGDLAAARNADDPLLHWLEEFAQARDGIADAPAWYALMARMADGSLLDDLAALRTPGGASDAGVREMHGRIDELQRQIDELRRHG